MSWEGCGTSEWDRNVEKQRKGPSMAWKKGGKTITESIVTIWDKKHYRDSFFMKSRLDTTHFFLLSGLGGTPQSLDINITETTHWPTLSLTMRKMSPSYLFGDFSGLPGLVRRGGGGQVCVEFQPHPYHCGVKPWQPPLRPFSVINTSGNSQSCSCRACLPASWPLF